MTENEILKLLSKPETQRKGFEMIVRQYSEMLYWKIRNIVLDHEDANDVLQNTFIKAWQGLGEFQSKSKLSTWLYRIAVNESLDHLRKKKNKVSADEDISVANRCWPMNSSMAMKHRPCCRRPSRNCLMFSELCSLYAIMTT